MHYNVLAYFYSGYGGNKVLSLFGRKTQTALLILAVLAVNVKPAYATTDTILAGQGAAEQFITETEADQTQDRTETEAGMEETEEAVSEVVKEDLGEDAPFRANIRFDREFEELTTEDTVGWRRVKKDGTYIWNEEKISEFFQELKEKYDTPYGQVQFTTHDGIKKLFKSDNCGWHLNVAMSVSNLEYAIEKGDVTVDPAWNSGLVYSQDNGVGNTYVEVSLDEQKVYLYEKGVNTLTTECVSGTKDYSDTRKGVFQVQYKASPSVLKDVDKNGNKYEQPVDYWVCFNGSQGLHDADWRSDFGGDYYKTWGSHGCVNLPDEAAQKIYKAVHVYTPVIVY